MLVFFLIIVRNFPLDFWIYDAEINSQVFFSCFLKYPLKILIEFKALSYPVN